MWQIQFGRERMTDCITLQVTPLNSKLLVSFSVLVEFTGRRNKNQNIAETS